MPYELGIDIDAETIVDLFGAFMMAGALIALGILVIIALVSLIYIYKSMAFMFVGRKANDPLFVLAWIPIIGNTIIAYRASGMHWWPWIIIGVNVIVGIYLLSKGPDIYQYFDSLVILTLTLLSGLIYAVFFIIWLWKLFEKVNWPGWLALLYIIPVVDLVVIGIVAWKKS